ncbi:hypothetical protein BDV23DRAFT_187632 [Aspergillus alliaceus]|uniref:Uncharacterized protein n=1 Tax=Petromyces alliaceus TaxID=209559 RepID=A0A5N7BW58_PETAA|nr:hypothetical protein BDV23DRAFT_187632 [Aspergillus alliaceus]
MDFNCTFSQLQEKRGPTELAAPSSCFPPLRSVPHPTLMDDYEDIIITDRANSRESQIHQLQAQGLNNSPQAHPDFSTLTQPLAYRIGAASLNANSQALSLPGYGVLEVRQSRGADSHNEYTWRWDISKIFSSTEHPKQDRYANPAVMAPFGATGHPTARKEYFNTSVRDR